MRDKNSVFSRSRAMRQNSVPKLVVPLAAALLIAAMVFVTKSADISALSGGQWTVMSLGAALFIFSFSSLIGGVWTVGMLPGMCIGTFLYICAVRWRLIMNPVSRSAALWRDLVFCAAGAAACVMIWISVQMLRASQNTARDGEKLTVIVLGCKIKKDEPSRMLAGRLDAAAQYLRRNPDTVCIVSGGQGPDEEYTEAAVMRDYLLRLGINDDRIIIEDRSVSTRENLAFSRRLILAHGLPMNVAIATDRFHQYRAALIARGLGINCRAINRETRWYLVMQYWMREIFGIIEFSLRGH